MDFLKAFLSNTWQLTADMAPYLLFGFAIAGLLHVLIGRRFVRRTMGKPGLVGVTRAAVIGVPMPLCSCSVIPVAATLRDNGASPGATASFLSSTPQTGVDSIFATYALLGGPFTVIRVVVAFISGIVSGLLIDLFPTPGRGPGKKEDTTPAPPVTGEREADKACCGSAPPGPAASHVGASSEGGTLERFAFTPATATGGPATLTPQARTGATVAPCCAPEVASPQTEEGPSAKTCCDTAPADKPATASCCSGEAANEEKRSFAEGLRYATLTLPADLARALVIGLVLAGLISTLLPADMLSGALSTGPLAFLLATAISLPLYVCATASIPMAYALIAAGLSPGAALVFLITGPATNTATVATVWKLLGRRATAIYLSTLVVVAWGAGALLNQWIDSDGIRESAHHHGAEGPAWWATAAGIALVVLLVQAVYRRGRT